MGPARARASLPNQFRRNPVATRRLLTALAAATATALLLAHVAGGAQRARSRWGQSVPVLVATAPLHPGDPLSDSTRTVRWPAGLVPRSALTQVGRDARAATAIDVGVPLTRALVARTPSRRRRRVALVLAGPRLPVRPGEAVDVWATSDPGTAIGAGTDLGTTTRRVAQGAVVLRSGQRTVVVAVSPTEERATAAAAATATITLTAPA